jgi:hypothetical protein
MSECHPYIRTFALTSANWTPIEAPASCSYFGIIGTIDGSPMLRCSDMENDQTCYQMNGPYALIAVPHGRSSPRYEEGDAVTYLKSVSATATAIVEFIL